MYLSEIIRELIEKKFKTQTALAAALNPMPNGIERAKPADVQRMASAGRNQEKQFAIFMKLLPMCRELEIDPARELIPLTAQEVINDVQANGAKAGGAYIIGKKKSKAEDRGTVPPRRNAGGQRKNR